MSRTRIDGSSAVTTEAEAGPSSSRFLRGANDNPGPGEGSVTDIGVALPRSAAVKAPAPEPPELVRVVLALARRAAREDYLAARTKARAERENHE